MKPQTPPIISVHNLRKVFRQELKASGFVPRLKSLFSPEYREYEAVRGIDLTVQPGEKIAFLGPNGAGKSTTIKMLTGILSPTSGEISVLGMDPQKDRKKLVYRIGAVFGQTSRLYYHLTPIDTFKLLGKMYDVPNVELRKRLDFLISTFGIDDFLRIPVRKLSLGQRMRAEVVASLIHRPDALFLDEPTIGLDMIAKQKLREIVNSINETEGTTVFLTSHDIGDIEHICNRVVVINHGTIVFDGSLDSLRADHIKEKRLRVRFSKRGEAPLPGFCRIVSEGEGLISVSIPNDGPAIREAFAYFSEHYSIEDITIEDPDLEEILRTFY